jgi:3-methyladenine DNA glycosylase AlkC
MTQLILPTGTVPTNLRLLDGTKVRYVDSDLYDIASRLKQVHPSIYVLEVEPHEKDVHWVIMENCEDGVQRLIFKVAELDGRVLKKLNQIMAMPLAHRLKKLEEDEYKMEADRKDAQLEDLYERVGRPMWTQLEHDGFIQRGVSYPKVGVSKPGQVR